MFYKKTIALILCSFCATFLLIFSHFFCRGKYFLPTFWYPFWRRWGRQFGALVILHNFLHLFSTFQAPLFLRFFSTFYPIFSFYVSLFTFFTYYGVIIHLCVIKGGRGQKWGRPSSFFKSDNRPFRRKCVVRRGLRQTIIYFVPSGSPISSGSPVHSIPLLLAVSLTETP